MGLSPDRFPRNMLSLHIAGLLEKYFNRPWLDTRMGKKRPGSDAAIGLLESDNLQDWTDALNRLGRIFFTSLSLVGGTLLCEVRHERFVKTKYRFSRNAVANPIRLS